MDCTQVLQSQPLKNDDVPREKCPVATLAIEGEYHTIYNTENVIGRDSACDVVINNNAISTRHAIIEAEDPDAHLIYDVGSTNKTKLGKMVLKPHVRYHINDGEYVTFGNVIAQYSISKQYPCSPVKSKPSLNLYSVPESPERPEPIQSFAKIEGNKVKVNSSTLNTSETDIFDVVEAISIDKLKENRNKANDDIYELDTLTFNENDIRQPLVLKQNLTESNIPTINKVVKDTPVSDLSVYDICTQEPIGNDGKNLSKEFSVYDKDKVKSNYEWEDFPEIASPDGLDTSNADDLDAPKPSSSLLDFSPDDLKKKQDSEDGLQSTLCKIDEENSTKQVAHTSRELSCRESDSEISQKLAHLVTTDQTKSEQYPHNDFYIPMSQNVDMFEDSLGKDKSNCPEEEDVYELLTQVTNEKAELNNPNESIYDLQTQVAIVRNESSLEVTISSKNNDDRTLESDILEPATQPFESNENVTRTSLISVKIIDETNQDVSFSTSMYEAATQPYPQFYEEKSISSLKEVSNKNLPENVDSISIETNIDGICQIATQKVVLKQPESKDEKVLNDCIPKNIGSLESEMKGDSSFSTSMYEAATQPHPQFYEEKSISLKEVLNKNVDSISVGTNVDDICEIATQICPKIVLKLPESKDEKVLNDCIPKNIGSLENGMKGDSSFSTSLYEAATQPHPQLYEEKSISLKEVLNKNLPENVDSISVGTNVDNICEIATQTCPKIVLKQPESKYEKVINDCIPKNISSLESEMKEDTGFSMSMLEAATQPCPEYTVESSKLNQHNRNENINNISVESLSGTKISTSFCGGMIQPIVKSKLTTSPDKILNKHAPNDKCELSPFEYEEATQPLHVTQCKQEKTEISVDKLVLDSDQIDGNNIFSTSVDKIVTQPCPLEVYSKSNLAYKTKDGVEKNVSFSDSMYEAGTQPCPYKSENVPLVGESIKNRKGLDLDLDEDEQMDDAKEINLLKGVCYEEMSKSFFEVATQPVPEPCHPNMKNDTKDKESSDNVIKVVVPVPPYNEPAEIVNQSTDNINEISNKTELPNILQVQRCDIAATRPSSALTASQKRNIFANETLSSCNIGETELPLIKNNCNEKSVDLKIKESLKGKSSSKSICEATKPEIEIKKNISADHESILTLDKHNFHEESMQPGHCSVVPIHEKMNEKLSGQTKIEERNVSVRSAWTASRDVSSTENLNNSSLPNTLSDSFFEAATQPYNSAEAADKTFLDPMTRICDDLSVDKISKISNELLYGNISKNLNETNLGNSSKSSSKVRQSLDSDNNIFEIVNRDSWNTSHEKTLASKIYDNQAGIMSTQDLKRILESDDLNQKYDGFHQAKIVTKSDQVVTNDNILLNKNDEAKDIVRKEFLKNSDDDTSQKLNVRLNKKRGNIFPPDSENFDDDSSQELNIRSKKKRSNIFPPDSQNFDNDDSSQELNVRSNKKRCNVFPSDSQDIINEPSQEPTVSVQKPHCQLSSRNKELGSNTFENIISNNYDDKSMEDNIKSVSDHDAVVKKSDNISVGNVTQRNTNESEEMNSNIDSLSKNAEKEESGENHYVKKNSKEMKNKSPSEREPSYISRGNITLHSPEVLTELEEQFRLTKVAMSPTQLSVVSDNDDLNSSQEVCKTPARQEVVRRSRRNKASFPVQKVTENSQLTTQQKSEPVSLPINDNLVKLNEIKIKTPIASQSEKSFKKFKKVSPMKNVTPLNEKDEKSHSADSSDNSQNSGELGRGKRKRVRTSYEGFILEEDIKRTSRKKLSFSQTEDNEDLNTSVTKPEESVDPLQIHQSNSSRDPMKNIRRQVSVVLHDIQKNPPEGANLLKGRIDKINLSKSKKRSSPIIEEESCFVSNNKKCNISINDEVSSKTKKSEIPNKENKNTSFSFSEKLDELFNIWGPADRVKLSPRVAKKCYKLSASSKNEDSSSSSSPANSKKSDVTITSNKANLNQSKGNANRNNKSTVVKRLTSPPDIKITSVKSNNLQRKRYGSQKSESSEFSSDVSELNKKRKIANSEASKIFVDVGTNNEGDSVVRKSSRIYKKKNDEVPSKASASDKISTRSRQANQEKMPSQSLDNKPVCNPAHSSNTTIEPNINNLADLCRNERPVKLPLNIKTKNSKRVKKNKEDPSSSQTVDDGCIFSQEYAFHEDKIQKVKKISSEVCEPPPVLIRRSSRKKNEKSTAVKKNVEQVMFTGFTDKKTKSIVNFLGGKIVESPFTCTVLVTDQVRRTTKFLSALSRGLPIVSPLWLTNSEERGKFLDVNEFMLNDKEAEKTFSFNLRKSIDKARNCKMLDGWSVFVSPSVKPSPKEMKSIIECSGGRFLEKIPAVRWPTNSLIVSCGEDRSMWNNFTKRGKSAPIIIETEGILLGVLRQELNVEFHRL